MITSSKINKILETYIKSKKISGHNVEVYENPTFDELMKIKTYYKDIIDRDTKITYRYLADANKQKIYVAAAYDAIHRDIRSVVGYPSNDLDTPYLLNGEAELKGRKLIPAWPYSTTISMCFKDYKLYKKLVPNELLYLNKAFEYLKNNG